MDEYTGSGERNVQQRPLGNTEEERVCVVAEAARVHSTNNKPSMANIGWNANSDTVRNNSVNTKYNSKFN